MSSPVTLSRHGSRTSPSLVEYLAVAGLMTLLLAQLTLGSLHVSMTIDEPSHIVNGYAVLRTGDLWTVPRHIHPVLVNAWAVLPLFFQAERPDPRELPAWGQQFAPLVRQTIEQLGPIERVSFVTRYPIMLLALLLLALVYRWARDLFGHWGGLLAVAVMVFDPTMVAHAQLNTTDLGLTLLVLACMFLLWRLLQHFSWSRLLAVGLTLGAALATKPSGLILVPALGAMLGWQALREGVVDGAMLRRGGRPPLERSRLLRSLRHWLGYFAAICALGLLVLWACYLFEWRNLPGLPFPIPMASHVRLLVTWQIENLQLDFLCGQRRYEGWWWYFPFAFAVKNPIPSTVALGATWLLAVRQRRQPIKDGAALWLVPLLYGTVAVLGVTNVGYRHMLPLLPFGYVALGQLGEWLARRHATPGHVLARGATLALAGWYVVGTLAVYPFPIAYYNELVGGPRNGYHYLVDSNTDWGQSFIALRQEMERRGIAWVWLSHASWYDPAAYGVRYRPLVPAPGGGGDFAHPYNPAPGDYAIGATLLQGVIVADPDTFEWFRHRQPLAQPGYGLLLYHVDPPDPPAGWLAQCNVPVVALTDEAIHNGLGRDGLRQLTFDCTQGWVYPGGGASGWYSFFRQTWLEGDDFLRQQLAAGRLSYEQERTADVPPFVLFEWHGSTPVTAQVRLAPAGWLPPQVEAERTPISAPVRMAGPLTFLGYRELLGKDEFWSYWQVDGTPQRPLSIMAHRVGADGIPIAVQDGLAVPIDQWQPGDVIVQRHRLAAEGMPSGVDWVEMGVYWLDTVERWTVAEEPGVDRLLLVR